MTSHWQTKPLAEVFEIKPPKSEVRGRLSAENLVSFVPMEDLAAGQKYLVPTRSRTLSEVIGGYTYFTDGDVLLAKITPCFENGKLGIARHLENGVGFGSSEYIVFRPGPLADAQWLYYFLTRNSFRSEGAASMSGAVGHKRVAKDFIENYQIPVPPIAEQRRIVGILDDAFACIATAKANTERNLRNASSLYETSLHSIFSRPADDWRNVPLAEICIVDWGNTDLTKSSYVEGGKFLAVSAAGCDGRIGHKEHSQYTPVLSAIGAQCGRMFLPNEDFTAIKNTITLTPCEGKCTGKFLYRLLTYVDLPKRGAAQPFISKGDIQSFRVVIPQSESDQKCIDELLSSMEDAIGRISTLYQRKLSALDALKQSLLHLAFSGQL
jgi:type I restriction enzyme S subunit